MQQPYRLTPVQAKHLFHGLPATRNAIIEGHIGLACAIARSWSHSRRRLADDLMGESLLGLVVACNRLPREDYVPYLVLTCRGYIQHLIGVERGVPLTDYDSGISDTEHDIRTKEYWEHITYKLTVQETTILHMFMADYTVEDIGTHFHMSRAWAQAQLKTIRDKVETRI